MVIRRIQLTINEEEFEKLKDLKGKKRTWEQFLVKPILDREESDE